MDPSYLAACALCLSFRVLNDETSSLTTKDDVETVWSKQLEFYSTYSLDKLFSGMQKIAKLTLKASDVNYKYRAATSKYAASKFFRISLLPQLSSSFFKEFAVNGTF